MSIVAAVGSFETRNLSIDGNLPLISSALQLPLGVSSQINATGPGYTSRVDSVGVAPQWTPSEDPRARAIIDWSQPRNAKTMPFVFTQGQELPPEGSNDYFGQNWAQGRSLSENYGGLVHATTPPIEDGPWPRAFSAPFPTRQASYADLYVDTTPVGSAEQLLTSNPDQRVVSTSGEVRATKHLAGQQWSQDITVMVRGRDTRALYGGSDTVDSGPSVIGQGVQVAEPIFGYSARNT